MARTKKAVLYEGKEIKVSFDRIKKLEIAEYLGSGGFADAWKVTDPKTSTHYVIKHIVVKSDLKGKERETFIKRIENEAAVDIPSPFVVKTHGLCKIEPDNYAILFQYIPNSFDLKDWLAANPNLPWKKKKKLYLDILKGVNDAHSRNIIHRDLKPENILIDEDGGPRIFDFGIAKFKDSNVSQSSEMKGTFPYMDPYAIRRGGIKYVDARCDIYALGIILYQMTHPNHKNPWQANNIEIIDFARHLTENVKKHILELDSSHPFTGVKHLKDIIINCTYFDLEKRFSSVEHIIARLNGRPKKKPVKPASTPPPPRPLPATMELDKLPEPRVPDDLTLPISKEKNPGGTPYLVIEDGSAMDAMIPLIIADEDVKPLGRRYLDITNPTISRHHACILRQGNRYFAYDAGSKNGTYFNGVKLKPGKENNVEIRHSDRIRFADLWTRFEFL